MKIFLLLLFNISIVFSVYSQEDNIVDSLKELIKSSEGITKINVYCELSDYIINTKHDEAEIFNNLKIADDLAEKNNNKKGKCRVLHSYGKYYFYKANYQKALEYILKAINIAEEENDSISQVELYHNIGIIYFNIGNEEKAKEFNQKSIYKNKFVKNKRFEILGNLLTGNLFYSKDLDSAEFYYKNALHIYETNAKFYNKETDDIILAYNNLGNLYTEKKEYEKAKKYLKEALVLNDKSIKPELLKAISLLSLAEAHANLQEYSEAEKCINKSIKISQNLHSKETLSGNYFLLYKVLKHKKDYKNALKFYETYFSLYDSIHGIEQNQKINELQIKLETEKKEQEFKIKKKEQEIKVLRNYLVFVGILLFLIIIVIILNRRRLLLKRAKESAEKNIELSKLKLKNAELEIDFKNKELSNFTNQLKIKSETIEKVEAEIEKLISNNDIKSANIAKEELINMKILSNDDWFKFKRLFDSVHNDYFKRFENKFPNLTEGDKRQIIMLKLGLSVQHTADSLGISQQAVWRGRQRLAIKIGLDNTKELKNIINNF